MRGSLFESNSDSAWGEAFLFVQFLQEHDGRMSLAEELWAGGTIADKDEVLDFLIKYRQNTLENGFVECGIQDDFGSTLTLDDHKKIQFRTTDGNLFDDFGKKMMDLRI